MLLPGFGPSAAGDRLTRLAMLSKCLGAGCRANFVGADLLTVNYSLSVKYTLVLVFSRVQIHPRLWSLMDGQCIYIMGKREQTLDFPIIKPLFTSAYDLDPS